VNGQCENIAAMRDIDKFEILIYFFHELYALCCRPV